MLIDIYHIMYQMCPIQKVKQKTYLVLKNTSNPHYFE